MAHHLIEPTNRDQGQRQQQRNKKYVEILADRTITCYRNPNANLWLKRDDRN